MKNICLLFFKKSSFTFYKRTLALLLAFVMIFNLSSEVFAQALPSQMPSKTYFQETPEYKGQANTLTQELEKLRQANSVAISYEEYKAEVIKYAKKNKIDINTIDIEASYKEYIAPIAKYESDYKALIKKFASKTYMEVITDSKYYLNKQDEEINYDGKKYNRVALLHAAIHNLTSRTSSGYERNGFWVFSQENEYTKDQRLVAMSHIYEVISREEYHPADNHFIWSFAYKVIEDGKEFYNNDFTTNHNLMPKGLRSGDYLDKKERAKEDRAAQANIVMSAVALMPVLSKSSSEKSQGAQIVYEHAKKIKRTDYSALGVMVASEALLAMGTEDSLNKLYALLTKDLYREDGVREGLYALDVLSFEEWSNKGANAGNRRNQGLGQYHNAIGRRYLYLDPKKNSKELLQATDSKEKALEVLYKGVFSDSLEEIGKAIGRASSQNERVAKLADKLALKYVGDTSGVQARESRMHTSVVVGILATTKKRSANLTKAANIIYNGYWWDISEATQRDKNNIAAKYLGYSAKKYNAGKYTEFKNLCYVKKVGRFADIALGAIFAAGLVLSLPSIVRSTGSFFKGIGRFLNKSIKNLKIRPLAPKASQSVKASQTAKAAETTKVSQTAKVSETAKAAEEVRASEGAKAAEEVKAPRTEQPEIKPIEETGRIEETTATVGEGGGGAIENSGKMTQQGAKDYIRSAQSQMQADLESQYKASKEAKAVEAENAARKGIVSKYKKTLLVNKPLGQLAPWRKQIATFLINWQINKEIFLSSLRVFNPRYAALSMPLPFALTGEAFLKPVAVITQTTRAAQTGITTAEVFRASETANEAANLAKAASTSQNIAKSADYLKILQDYSMGKGLLSGTFGINGILNEYHGGPSASRQISALEKNNVISYAKQKQQAKIAAKKEEIQAMAEETAKNVQTASEIFNLNHTQQILLGQYLMSGKVFSALPWVVAPVFIGYIIANALYDDNKKMAKFNFEQAQKAKLNLGENYNKNDLLDILKFYDEAVRLSPKKQKYYQERANFKLNYLEDYEGAFADYTKLIELAPKNAKYYYDRANIGKKIKGRLNVLEDYNKAIELDGKNAQYLFERAEFKENVLSDHKGALEDLNEAIKLDPSKAAYYYQRALILWYESSGVANKPQAIEDIKNAIKYAPEETYYSYKLEEWQKEVQYVQDDRQLYTEAEEKYNNEDYQGALESINQALEKESNNAVYYLLRAHTKEALGDYQGAVDDYELAAKYDPANAELYFNYRAYAGEKMDELKTIENFQKLWQGLKEKLFGKETNSGKLFALPIPMPEVIMQILTRELTLDQLANRDPKIEDSFIKAYEKTSKELNEQEVNNKQAAELFVFNLKEELPISGVESDKANAFIDKVQNYIQESLKQEEIKAKANKYFEDAFKAYESGNAKEAIENANLAIKLDKTNPRYYFIKALAEKFLLQNDAAIKDFKKAIGYETNEILKNSYNAYIKEIQKGKKRDTNIEVKEDNTKEKSSSVKQYYKEASKAYMINNKKALEFYNKAISKKSDNAKWYYERGNVNEALGNMKDAERDFRKAIELDSKNSTYYEALALLEWQFLGKKAEAIEHLEKAIKYNNFNKYNTNILDITNILATSGIYKEFTEHYKTNNSKENNDFQLKILKKNLARWKKEFQFYSSRLGENLKFIITEILPSVKVVKEDANRWSRMRWDPYDNSKTAEIADHEFINNEEFNEAYNNAYQKILDDSILDKPLTRRNLHNAIIKFLSYFEDELKDVPFRTKNHKAVENLAILTTKEFIAKNIKYFIEKQQDLSEDEVLDVIITINPKYKTKQDLAKIIFKVATNSKSTDLYKYDFAHFLNPKNKKYAKEYNKINKEFRINESFNMGKDYYEKNMISQAIDEFIKVLKKDSNNARAYTYLAKCYLKLYNKSSDQADLDNAVKYFKKAKSLKPTQKSVPEFADFSRDLHAVLNHEDIILSDNGFISRESDLKEAMNDLFNGRVMMSLLPMPLIVQKILTGQMTFKQTREEIKNSPFFKRFKALYKAFILPQNSGRLYSVFLPIILPMLATKTAESSKTIGIPLDPIEMNMENVSSDEAKRYVNIGNRACCSEEYRLAYFQQALELEPNNAEINRLVAHAEYQLYLKNTTNNDSKDDDSEDDTELLNSSLKHYTKAISSDVDNGTYYHERSKVRKALGDYTYALYDLDAAVSLDQKNAAAHFDRYKLKKDHFNDLQGALPDLDKAIEYSATTNPEYNRERAKVREDAEDYQGALEDLNVVIKYVSHNPEDFWMRGIAKKNLGDIEGAYQDCNRAINLDKTPDYKHIKFYLDLQREVYADKSHSGTLFALPIPLPSFVRNWLTGQNNKAKEEQKARQEEIYQQHQEAENHYMLGEIFAHSHEYEQALKEYNKAIELDSEKGLYYYRRALLKKEHKEDIADVLNDLAKSIKYARKSSTNSLKWLFKEWSGGQTYEEYIKDNNADSLLEELNKLVEEAATKAEQKKPTLSAEAKKDAQKEFDFNNVADKYFFSAIDKYNKDIDGAIKDLALSLKYGNYENKYILAKFQEWTGQSYEDYIKANPEFAPDNVKTFRQFIKGLKEKLFGKENNSGVLMASIAILPLPDFAKRFLTGGPTFTRKQKVAQAEIERAFDYALLQTQRALAEDNTQAAMVLFMENLKDNLDNTTYISNIKKQEVIKTTQKYIQAKYDAAQQEKMYLSMAYSNFKNGNYEKALEYFNNIIEINANNVEAVFYKNVLEKHLYHKKVFLEKSDFEKMMEKLEPKTAEDFFYMARANHLFGNFKEAIAYYQKSIEKYAYNDEVYYYFARLYGDPSYSQYNAKEALRYYNEAIKIEPNEARYYFDRALLKQYDFNQTAQAIDDLYKARSLDPANTLYFEYIHNFEAQIGRKPTYFSEVDESYAKGNYLTTIKAATANIEKNPYDAFSYYYRAKAQEHIGPSQRTALDYDNAVNNDPNNITYRKARAEYTKKEELAQSDLQRAEQLKYIFNNAMSNLRKYIFDADNPTKLFALPIPLPKFIRNWLTGQNNKAKEEQKARQEAPSQAEVYYTRAQLEENAYKTEFEDDFLTGDLNKALGFYNEAIKLDPNNAKYHFAKAEHLYHLRGDHQAALPEYDKAIELDKNNYKYYEIRAVLKKEYLKDIQGAIQDLALSIKHGNNDTLTLAMFKSWAGQSYEDYIKANPDFDSQVQNNTTEIDKAANQVKNDILGKYNQTSLMMAVLPINFFDFNRKIVALLTNKPYLSEEKQEEVIRLIDQVSAEVAKELIEETFNGSIYGTIKDRAFDKIQKSDFFTDKEKEELIGKKTVEYLSSKQASQEEINKDVNTNSANNLNTQPISSLLSGRFLKIRNRFANILTSEKGKNQKAIDIIDQVIYKHYLVYKNAYYSQKELKEAIIDELIAGISFAELDAYFSDSELDSIIGKRLRKIKADELSNEEREELWDGNISRSEAIEYLSKAIKLDPKNPEYYYKRYYLKEPNANVEELLEDLNKALELKKDAYYYYVRAKLQWDKIPGAKEAAIEDMRQAAKRDRSYKQILADWTKELEEINAQKAEEGVNSTTQTTTQNQNNSGVLYMSFLPFTPIIRLISKLISVKETKEKEIQEQPQIKEIQEQPQISDNTISSYDEMIKKQKAEARARYEQALFGEKMKPYYQTRRNEIIYNQTLSNYNAAIDLDPTNPEYHYAKGEFFRSVIKYTENLDYYEKILDTFYPNVDYYREVALHKFDDAIRIDPEYADAYFERAFVKNELGDIPGAINDLAMFIKYDKYKGKNIGTLFKDWSGGQTYEEYIKDNPDFAAEGQENTTQELTVQNQNNSGIVMMSLLPIPVLPKPIQKLLFGNLTAEQFINGLKTVKTFIQAKFNHIMGENAEALKYYNKAIKLDPTAATLYYERAKLKYEMGDNQGSLADFDKAIELDATKTEYYYDRAILKYYGLNEVKPAIRDLAMSIKYGQKDKDTLDLFNKWTGQNYEDFIKDELFAKEDAKEYVEKYKEFLRAGNYELALEYMAMAATIDPSNARTHYDSALLNWNVFGNKNAAILDIKAAVLNEPNNALYKQTLEKWTKELGNKSEEDIIQDAKDEIFGEDKKTKAQIPPAQNQNNSGVLMAALIPIPIFMQKMLIGQLTLAQFINNIKEKFYYKQAKSANRNKKYQQAVSFYDKLIAANPKAQYYFERFKVKYYKLHLEDEGIADLDKAIRLDPTNAEYYCIRGNVEYLDPKMALNYYTKAIELDPTNSEYYLLRALLYSYNFTNNQAALQDLEKAIEYGDDLTEIINTKHLYKLWSGKEYKKEQQEQTQNSKENLDNIKAEIKSDILDQYNNSVLMATFFIPLMPSAVKLGQMIVNFLTNRSYLSDEKKAIVINIIEEAAINAEKVEASLDEKKKITIETVLKEIENSSAFSADEKLVLLNRLQRKYDAEVYNEKGFQAFMQKDFIAAKDYADKSIQLDRINAYTFAIRANLKRILGDYKGALEDYNIALSMLPRNAEWYAKRAYIKERYLNDIKGSLEDYNIAITIAPGNAAYYYSRAKLKRHRFNQYEEALQDYQKAAELNPANARYYYEMADSEFLNGNYEKSLYYYNQTIARDSNSAQFYLSRGYLKYRLKDFKGALADYDKAVELEPQNAEYYNKRGVLKRFSLEDYQGSLADYSKAIELNPNNPDYYNNRASLLRFYFKDFNAALQDYNIAISLKPTNAEYYVSRATVKFVLNDYKGAIEDYTKAIELNPNVAEVYAYRAAIYVHNFTDFRNSLADYNKAIKLNPNVADWYNMRGYVKDRYFRDHQGALDDFNKAIKIDPNHSKAYINRAAVKFYTLKDKQGAFKDYTKAIKIDPTNGSYYYERAKKYYLINDLNAAINDIKNALKYEPQNEVYKVELEKWTKELNSKAGKQNFTQNNIQNKIDKVAGKDFTTKEKIASKEGISKENFKQKLSELEKDIFSKKNDNKLMMVFFPGLTEIARLIENTVFQYSQKRTKQIFKQTEEETLLQIQGEDFGGAMNIFLYNLRENLLRADFSRKDITNLFKRIKAYMTKEFSEEEINQQAEAYFTKATEAQNLGEFKLAEKYYNLAIELNPYNSKFYSARAAIRKELNKDEEAYQDSVKAAEVSSDYYDLAVSEYELGKKEAAIEHLKLAIKNTTDESKIESYIKILQQWYGSLSSQKKKKDKEAQKAKEEAAKEEQRLAQAYLNTFNAQNELAKAKQFISDSEYEKALKIYNDLIRFAPIDADYYFYRADLLQTYLGRTSEALQDLNTALNIDTTNSKYYIRRGLLLWYGFGDLENRAKALKDFSAAAKYNKTYTKYLEEYTQKYNIEKSAADQKAAKLQEMKEFYAEFYKDVNNKNKAKSEEKKQPAAKNNKKTTKEAMQGLNEEIFGKRNKTVLFSLSVIPLPLPKFLGSILSGGITLEQLLNSNPAIQKAFDEAEEEVINVYQNIDNYQVIDTFIYVLSRNLQEAKIPDQKRFDLMQASLRYMASQLSEEDRKEAAKHYAKTLEDLLEQGPADLGEVLSLITTAIIYDDTNPEYYITRATYEINMEPKLAKEDFEKAIALDPENQDYQLAYKAFLIENQENLGIKNLVERVYNEFINKLATIIDSLKKTILPPTQTERDLQAEDFARRAYNKLRKGYLQTSLAYYNNAIALNPKKAEYYYERALLKQNDLKDYTNAAVDYINAMELDPENADFYMENSEKAINTSLITSEETARYKKIAAVNIAQDNFDGALFYLDKILELNPVDDQAYFDRATVKYEQNNLKEAFVDISKAINLNSRKAEYFILRSKIAQNVSGFEASLKDLDKAIELSPNNDAIYAIRAGVRYLLNNINGAVKDIEKAIKINPENAYYYNDLATFMFDLNDPEYALEDISKAIDLYSEDPEFYTFRAKLYFDFKRYEEMLADYDSAIRLDPENPYYYQLKAKAHASLGNDEDALELLDKAVSMNPQDMEPYIDRIMLKEQMGDYDGMIDDCDIILDYNPMDPFAYYYRGIAKEELEDYVGALEDYNYSILIDPDNPEVYFDRAALYEVMGDYDNALQDYDTAIKLDDGNTFYYSARGVLKDLTKDTEGALKDAKKAIELDSDNPEGYSLIAEIQYKAKDYKNALENIEEAIELSPNNADFYITRANIKIALKDTKGAMQDFDSAIYFDEDRAPLFYYLKANSLYEINQPKKALQNLNKAIAIDKEDTSFYILRSEVKMELKDYKGALIDANEAVKLSKAGSSTDLGKAYMLRGISKESLDDLKGALKDLNLALSVEPDIPQYYFHRGMIKAKSGNIEGAKEDYSKAIELAPDNELYKQTLENLTRENDAKKEEFSKNLMQGLKDEVLGKQNSGKLLSLVLPFPLPKFLKQILMGDITFEQFLNNTPEIKQAIENAEEKTFKEIKNISKPDEIYLFLINLTEELQQNNVEEKQATRIINTSRDYMISQFSPEERKQASKELIEEMDNLRKSGMDTPEIMIKLSSAAIDWDDSDDDLYFTRMFYETEIFALDEAKEDFEKLLKKHPGNQEYLQLYEEFLNKYKYYFKQNQDKFSLKKLINKILGLFKKNKPTEQKASLDENTPAFTVADIKTEAQDIAEEAYQKVLKSLNASALAYYNIAIVKDPSKAEYFYERGLLKQDAFNEHLNASEDFITAMELDPENADFYMDLASKSIDINEEKEEESKKYESIIKYKIENEEWDEALKLVNKALALNPNNDYYQYAKSLCLLNTKNLDGALENISKAIELNPNRRDYYYTLSIIYSYYHDLPDALKALNKALSIKKTDSDECTDSDLYTIRATIKYNMKDTEGALQDCKIALKTNKENAVAYLTISTIKYNQKDYDESLDYINKAIEIMPEEMFYLQRIMIKFKLQDYDGAFKDYDTLIAMNPKNIQYYVAKAKLYFQIERYQEGLECLDKAISFEPNNIDLYILKTSNLYLMKDYYSSIESAEDILKLDSKNDIAYYQRGAAKFFLKDYDSAMQDFDLAIKYNPNRAQYYNSRSALKKLNKDLTGALQDIEDAIKLDPKAEYFYQRGLICEQLNNADEAAASFLFALSLDQNNQTYQTAVSKYIQLHKKK